MATDNIVILGSLRGLAHAGAKGNKEAIISVGKLEAVQLRIANIVKELSKEETEKEQVYIHAVGEEIVIEQI